MPTQLVDERPAAPIKHETLFEGRDLALDVYDGGHSVSIITFESRNKYISATKPSPFGPGFGRGRFAPLGFNEYLVRRNRNHWYQTDEMIAVADIINSRTSGTRVITYGSSMGGFAAINFASMLNADQFIALSPLQDIAPGNEAGDRRWSESAVLDFTHNRISTGDCLQAHGYVFYCHDSLDEAHARLLKRDTLATLVAVDYGGHPCSFFLNDTYGLKRLVAEIGTQKFDLDDFHRILEEKTEETFYPYERRSLQLAREGGDLGAAIEQLRIAISRKESLPRLHTRLGDLLRKSGDLPNAEIAYRSSLALHPASAASHIGLSYAHASRGDYASAVEAVNAAITIAPKPEFYARLGEWLILKGDLAAAEQAILRVIDLVPDAVVAPRRLEAIRQRLALEARSGVGTPVASPRKTSLSRLAATRWNRRNRG